MISASSNSPSPLDIIPTHLVKSFPDYYFFDLEKFLNASLKAGCFTQSLKMVIFKPHLKYAYFVNRDISSYWPISNLSYISKLLERAAFMQMRENMEKNSLSSKYQNAYPKFFLQKQRWFMWQTICSSIMIGQKALFILDLIYLLPLTFSIRIFSFNSWNKFGFQR